MVRCGGSLVSASPVPRWLRVAVIAGAIVA